MVYWYSRFKYNFQGVGNGGILYNDYILSDRHWWEGRGWYGMVCTKHCREGSV